MKILFLAHRIPFPPFKGDKLRAFNIIKHLSQKHDIHLMCVTHVKGEIKYKNELLKYCKSVDIFYVNLLLKKLLTPLYILKGLPLTLPFFYSANLMKIVSDKCKTMDMAFIFSSSMAQYVLDLKIPKIMDFIDADSDKWSQYAKYGKFPANIIYKRESVLLAKHEEKILKNVYASIAVSESETEALKSIYPKANLFSVSNGVDFNHFKPTGVKPKDNIITFTGEMNYFANVDAVTYFYTSVLPLIKQKVPDAIFYIVGRNPDKKVLELQKDKTVIVTGEIPDVREFISTAKVCAVPMRIGRGIQNKVLEAMSMEKSVVATPLAVRGIKVIDEKEIFVAGNAEIFAKKVIDLLNNEPLRESTGKSARKAIEERYSWDTNLKALDRIITELPILGGTY